MISRLGIALALAAGCGATSGSSSNGQPLGCDPVIPSLFHRSQAFAEQVWAGQRPELQTMLADMLQKVTAVMVQSCQQDRWSAELLGCLDGMTVTDDPHKCNHLFTQDQAVGLARRLMAVLAPPAAAPPPS
jgi:hypothetical protein